MRSIIYLLVFSLGIVCTVSAQLTTDDVPNEQITLHLSQRVLFSGETLWYTIYCQSSDEKDVAISRLVYAELVNSIGESIFRKKVLLDRGVGESYFDLPDSISTGVYSIRTYTAWMKNFGGENVQIQKVAVVNPSQMDLLSSVSESSDESVEKLNHAASFQTRSQHLLSDFLSLVDIDEGNYSVSIKRKEPLFIENYSDNKSDDRSFTFRFFPDYNGAVLNGVVCSVDDKRAGGVPILLSYPGRAVEISKTVTVDDGSFKFLLPAREGSIDLVFILPDNSYKLKLNSSFNEDNYETKRTTLLVNEENVEFIKEKFIYSQLKKKFKLSEDEISLLNEHQEKELPFYRGQGRSYVLANYTKLDSLLEYFYEIVPTVRVTEKKGKYGLRVFTDHKITHSNVPPVLFIDGVMYTDYNKLAQISSDIVERIDVVSDRYFYKEFTFDGIVNIQTKRANLFDVELQDNMYRVIYPLADKVDKKWSFDSREKRAKRVPDLRYLLYWGTNMNRKQLNDCSFQCSDIPGVYVATIKGVDEKGNVMVVNKEFTVAYK